MKNKLDQERLIKIAFLSSGIGRKAFVRMRRFINDWAGSWGECWKSSERTNSKLVEMIGLSENQKKLLKDFRHKWTPESYFGWLQSQQIEVFLTVDKDYPKELHNIDDKPQILYAKNWNKGKIDRPIAVVGTRKVTPYGRVVTRKIVSELVEQGCTIISGFMYGVDTIAHKVALEYGGQTIGVLGYGFGQIFPAGHRKIFDKLFDQGMSFVSEYPPGIPPEKWHFPERNRIVAGLSKATVVTEGAAGSGSLITANLAAEYGRDVFAVPGNITSKYSDGTREAINYGAKLVANGQEVIEEMGWENPKKYCDFSLYSTETNLLEDLNFDQNSWQARIIQLLHTQPLDTEELFFELKFEGEISQLTSILNILSLEGLIVRQGQRWFLADL